MRLQLFLTVFCGLLNLGQCNSNNSVAPISVPPSLYWDGEDGWWSTFSIQVGTPGQTVRLLPGTSANAGSTIWTVISEGCAAVNPDLTNCQHRRGGLFQSNLSSSWSTEGIKTGVDGAIFSLSMHEERFLGLDGNGSYGYDTVSLGLPGSGLPTLENLVIAGIWTNDFFLGNLGISPVPFNFTNLNDPQPSLLGILRNHSLISSASWGYTAGAYYQTPPVFGSLTLGGYDTTRFTPNNLTLAFGADFSRDLLVSLQSITYDTAGSSPLLASRIDMFIDSLVTEIWLPVNVCQEFATQFNLTWNTQGQLYLIEEESHTALLAQNPTFTFTIGQAGGGGETIDIVLPYAAFDLNLTAPIVGDTTRYFPLKQAQNSTQYTLGRTFLQEAYVIADYERHEFSIAQALFPPTSIAQNIIPILAPSQASNTNDNVTVPAPDKDSEAAKKSLSTGAIAGIVVGSVVAIIVAVIALLFWLKRPANDEPEKEDSTTSAEASGEENGVYEADENNFFVPEADAYEGPHGRHELPTAMTVHETDGRQLTAAEGETARLQLR